jgi:hypothetical protein
MSDVKEQVEAAAPAAEAKAVEEPKTQDTAQASGDVAMESTTDAPAVETPKNGKPATTTAGPKTGRKYDASQLPVTDDPDAIRHQVCFSDPSTLRVL